MISNRCTRKSLVTNCNSIISKNYLRFLVDSNAIHQKTIVSYNVELYKKAISAFIFKRHFILLRYIFCFSLLMPGTIVIIYNNIHHDYNL